MDFQIIGPSDDLDRILRLPRREEEPPSLPLPDLGGVLRPIQESALRELLTYKGAFVSARVGAGKTLISLLAGTVIEAKRPLLLVPAKLKEKTLREAKEYGKTWNITLPIIVSYELLGRTSGAEVLGTLLPDLIILDEAHKVSNTNAAVTRRVGRYLQGDPSVRVLAMSGTLTRRDLKDFAHIARWCCKDYAPVPKKWPVLEQWSLALGASTNPWERPRLGALREAFAPECSPIEDAYGAVRKGYAERIWATPTCLQTTDGLAGVGLEIGKAPFKIPPKALSAIKEMQKTWCTPNGDEIVQATELYAHAKELSQGFYYRWTEKAPKAWMEARRAWKSWMRETLNNSRTYDSPLQVENAVKSGALQCNFYEPWMLVRETFKPKTEAVWIDDSLIKAVASYKFERPTLVWVEHDAVGQALSTCSIGYYGARGELRTVRHGGLLDVHRRALRQVSKTIEACEGQATVAASIAANAEGRNLQQWSHNLVLSPPSMGSTWEQLLGRTHRDGQTADTVDVMVYAPTDLHANALTKAKHYAKYIQDTTGQEQKLLSATWTFDPEGK